MEKKEKAFDKINFIIIAIGMALVIIGFLLMSGASTDIEHFEESIFSVRRIKVAPVLTLLGFIVMIGGVVFKSKSHKKE